ncbi:lipopolysaccharide biosynthesis protein [Bdellovibrio bacteriovorus]|uniref:lipopolysaccharide biosynthesis protein n=1 Tax=Bdellovibrio bacteriovorus TaxID=959 RepID=UPI0035A65A35
MFRVLNVALRGVTLLCKFLLVFFLAKFLPPDEVGLYGLLVGSIGYAIYLVGFEFYTFSTREIIRSGPDQCAVILKNQLFFTVVMYLISLPVLGLLFFFRLLPIGLAGWFFVLLLLEHFAQEFNRIFVAIGRQLLASGVLFLRSGLWVVIALVFTYMDPSFRTLSFILLLWVCGGTLACLVSIYFLLKINSRGWSNPVDKRWVRRGVVVAVPFLISALAIRGTYTLDRFWLEYLVNLKVVGVYVLFAGICNALVSVVDSGFFVFAYPELIKAHDAGNSEAFRKLILRLGGQVLLFCVLFGVVAGALLGPLLRLLGRPIYVEMAWMFPLVLVGAGLSCVGSVAQYGLYAQGKDRQIVFANVLSFVAFLLVTYASSFLSRMAAVPVGLAISSLVGAVWCTVMFLRLSPVEYWRSPRHSEG